MAFSDLQKRKNKTFLEKQYAAVRAIIEQTPYGVFLKGKKVAILNREICTYLCTNFPVQSALRLGGKPTLKSLSC